MQNIDDIVSARTAPHLLNILVCPQTLTSLIYDHANHRLISLQAKCAYRFDGNMPILLVREAEPLDQENLHKWQRFKRKTAQI